jgi:hypothetical protein
MILLDFCYIYLLRTKDEALEHFNIYKTEVENRLDKKIKRLWYDRGGEYLSNLFDEYCKECGIIHETTTPYSPQSNGVAKRKNQIVCDLANALLQSSGMPDIWWGEAVLTVCYVLNRVPPRNRETMPYEGFKGRKPDLSHLWTWGCLAKVNVPLSKKRNLDPKTVDCVFLGYAHNNAAYRFLVVYSEMSEVVVNVIMESRDVAFFESIFPMRDKEVVAPDGPSRTCSLSSSVLDQTPDLELRRSIRDK